MKSIAVVTDRELVHHWQANGKNLTLTWLYFGFSIILFFTFFGVFSVM